MLEKVNHGKMLKRYSAGSNVARKVFNKACVWKSGTLRERNLLICNEIASSSLLNRVRGEEGLTRSVQIGSLLKGSLLERVR
jgi:hypothetical protein